MPGVDLALSLPSLSDTLSVIVAKAATALQAIEDDLASKVVPAEININSALSFNGAAATNLGSAYFVSGNVPDTAGAFWYDSGEFYCRDATGQIQLTSNGSLNIAAVGGIVGDYGGSNPARVTYDDASGEYRFTEDTGVYADLVGDDLILNSTTGSVRFAVDDAVTSARQFIIKDLPGAGISALVYDASTSTVESAENKRITNTLKATNVDATGTLNLGGNIYVTERTLVLSFGDVTGSFSSGEFIGMSYISMPTTAVAFVNAEPGLGIFGGAVRIKKITAICDQNTIPGISYEYQDGSFLATTFDANPFNITNTSNNTSGGFMECVRTLVTPHNLPVGGRFAIKIHNLAAGDFKVYRLSITIDVVP